jgi:polyisoprenyl-phosphate glycosyltransferase
MKLAVVTPVLDDWPSCRMLLARLDALNLPGVDAMRVLIVNDGSIGPVPPDLCADIRTGRLTAVDVLDLGCNVGHQRAIALGIAAIAADDAGEHVVVMDCDGEDDPADVPRLIAALRAQPEALVVAMRAHRSEGLMFRAGYFTYQTLFRITVGRRMDFGNFCAFGPSAAARLARMPDIWNHLAAATMRSRLPIARIETRRAARFAGRSTMNGPALIAHGLSAFAVFSEQVFARLLLFASAMGGVAVVGILIVLAIRFGTNLAIPGWATIAIAGLGILLMQAILVSLVASVQLLATRNQPGAVPLALLATYVRRTLHLLPATKQAIHAV